MGITLAPMAEWRLYKIAHLQTAKSGFRKFRNWLLVRDSEKWAPVFGKDRAATSGRGSAAIGDTGHERQRIRSERKATPRSIDA